MNLNPRSIADVLVFAPAGRLDHESVDAFRSDLQPQLDAALQAGRGVLFDLSALEYVSSAGLRCFMLAAKQANAKQGKMAVAAPRPVVAEIFEISRFNMVFRIFPSLREGLGYLSADAAAAFERG
jgi:anti-sigma B factor antagonist